MTIHWVGTGLSAVPGLRRLLAGKTPAEKTALRNTAALRPIIARLEEEKGKKSNVNADALLGELAGDNGDSQAE